LDLYPDVRFVIVGKATPREAALEQALKDQAVQLGVSDKVAFLGYRNDAIEILSELYAVCVTSDREPFPRVILEAQLAGCAVVASNTGGCVEMIRHGETGLLFSPIGPRAPVALAKELFVLLEDERLSGRIVSRARREVTESFGNDAPARRLEGLLRGIAGAS
jgi:glycosyltransferase involved in cell wall biosynthesis